MVYRCHQSMKHQPYYANYRGRGIEVCEEWRFDFDAFKEWALSSGYERGLTLERKDNNGPYDPANCVWTTRVKQQRNQRRTVMVTLDNESRPLKDWCELYGVSYQMAYNRIVRWKQEPLAVFTRLGKRRG